jgi:hypothetical protein
LIGYFETHPQVGIVGPKILNRDGSIQGSARATHLIGGSTDKRKLRSIIDFHKSACALYRKYSIKKWKSFIGEGYADSYLTTTRLLPVSNIKVWPVGLFAETLVTWTVLSPLLTA